jgi:hypothetical protein
MNNKGLIRDYENYISLAKYEPNLADLLEDARNRSYQKHTWSEFNEIWYKEFKPTMCSLVGMDREDNPKLGTSEAYDTAYNVLYFTLTGESLW